MTVFNNPAEIVTLQHRASPFTPHDLKKNPVRCIIILVLLANSIVSSTAQDAPPKSVKTLKIQKSSPETTALYAIDPDGTVKIDWEAVETLVSSKADRTMSPVAEVCWLFVTASGSLYPNSLISTHHDMMR
jgi:hypothetical protein